jgi:hypothetical protein
MAGKTADYLRPVHMFATGLVALCFLGFARAAGAANDCPWVNEATVSGLLGGQSVGTFSPGQTGQPATCRFVYKTSVGTRTLTVDVERTQDAHARVIGIAKDCAQQSEFLPAAGNEASMCVTEHSKDRVTGRVVGRVRDQVFTIMISTSGKGDAALSMGDLRSRISTATEQVTGNLF